MSFALLLSTFFTSIFTSIPRTDNSISPSPLPHLSATRRHEWVHSTQQTLITDAVPAAPYRLVPSLLSYRWTEFRLPGRERGGRGEGVRSETHPTRLHLIRRTKRSDKTIRQMLDEQKKLQGRLIARENKALRMDVGWRSDIEDPVKYVCHQPAESDRSLGDPK